MFNELTETEDPNFLDLINSFVDTYPQSLDGKLLNAISGSAAMVLLMQADKITHININEEGQLVDEQPLVLKFTDAVKKRYNLDRPRTDIDVVTISKPAQFGKGGPLFLDPLPNQDKEFLKLSIKGKEFYITHPKSILAFKALQMLESFQAQTTEKRHKWLADAMVIIEFLVENFSWDTLAAATSNVILPDVLDHNLPLSDPDFSRSSINNLVLDAIRIQQDFELLKEYINHDSELFILCVDILIVLSRFKSNDAKQAILKFITENEDAVLTNREPASTDRNIQIILEALDSDNEVLPPDIKAELAAKVESIDDSERKVALIGSPYLIRKIFNLTDLQLPDFRISTSYILRILMFIGMREYQESEFNSLLEFINFLINKKLSDSDIHQIYFEIENYRFPDIDNNSLVDKLNFIKKYTEDNPNTRRFYINLERFIKTKKPEDTDDNAPNGWTSLTS